NQQRLIAKRECRIANQLLVAVYPMRGLDVGAVERLREMIMERRDAGAAILLVSEELDELLEMSDRIAVLNHGRIVGVLDAEEATLEKIGLLMGGETIGLHA
ncbi:MAG: heme ABC transporter ATP-binding protein, partial [Pseudomonadota bacterium]